VDNKFYQTDYQNLTTDKQNTDFYDEFHYQYLKNISHNVYSFFDLVFKNTY
jgi:hypothetical protein